MLETLKNLVDPRVWLAKWQAASWKVKLGLVLVGTCVAYGVGAHYGMLEVPELLQFCSGE